MKVMKAALGATRGFNAHEAANYPAVLQNLLLHRELQEAFASENSSQSLLGAEFGLLRVFCTGTKAPPAFYAWRVPQADRAADAEALHAELVHHLTHSWTAR